MAERERAGEESSRPHAFDIYARVCDDTAEELERPVQSLFYSGLFAGFTIGLAPLAVALATASLGSEVKSTAFIAALLYPIGYIAVIVGRSQFFTENTLYPVMLSLRRPEFFGRSARLWLIVFTMNLIGAALFALLAATTGALDSSVQSELAKAGVAYTSGSFADTFFSALVTGFLLALVAWLVEGSDSVSGRIAVIWAMTFVVAIGTFDHCIATTVAGLTALFDGDLGFGALVEWFVPVVLGNVLGGVGIVAAINYGQVEEEE